jgi:hypothetical protein
MTSGAVGRVGLAALHSFQRMLESSGGSRDLLVVSHGLGNLIILFERLGQPTVAA